MQPVIVGDHSEVLAPSTRQPLRLRMEGSSRNVAVLATIQNSPDVCGGVSGRSFGTDWTDVQAYFGPAQQPRLYAPFVVASFPRSSPSSF